MVDDEVSTMLSSRFETPSPRTGVKPRIVFWMDAKGEFSDSFDRVDLGDVRIMKWDGCNGFLIKYTVESLHPELRFLIYVQGAVPSDEENILADMMHYSRPFFSADKASCTASELGIPEHHIDVIREHEVFFRNRERGRRMMALVQDIDDTESILSAMVATALGSGSSEVVDILLKVVTDFAQSPGEDSEDDILSRLERYGLADAFWRMCDSEFGFKGDSIGDLIRSLIIVAATHSTAVCGSPKLSGYVLRNHLRAHSIVSSLINDPRSSDSMNSLMEWVSTKVGMDTILEAYDNRELSEVGFLPKVDDIISRRCIEQILSTLSPLDDSSISIIVRRSDETTDARIGSRYGAISAASELIRRCHDFKESFSDDITVSRLISGYVSDWNRIDTCYRHFIRCSDESRYEDFDALSEFVENTYTNLFLGPIIMGLCSRVDSYSDLPGPPLTGFHREHIDTGRNMVVIISDAFRYECAAELNERLKTNRKIRESRLQHMISTVPSITSFGMAALLPNEGLEVSRDGRYDVLINGHSTVAGSREIVLRSTYPDSIVVAYDQIVKNGKATREACKGKHLIYVYHNVVDAIGDSASTEGRVFSACEDAMKEISNIIRIITNWNYTKFVVTADHGFIYRRGTVQDYDKIQTVDEFCSSRRYALNDRPFGLERTVEFSLDYLHEGNDGLYVSVPDSMSLFKLQGGGLNFVHGGISPQEIVVPVLTVNTVKGAVSERYTGLKSSGRTRVRQNNPSFKLLQENPASNEYRETEYEVWLEDVEGTVLTTPKTVRADRTDPSDLEHTVKFEVKLTQSVVRMVIRNRTNPDEEPVSIDYNVNILFDNYI